MMVLRCTQRLLKSSRAAPEDALEPPGVLEEWYANSVPLRFAGRWMTVYMSVDTLLSVVTPGRTIGATLPVFRERLPVLLRRLEVPEAWSARRMDALGETRVTRTADRRMLGYLNNAIAGIEYWQDEVSSYAALDIDRMELGLAGTPYAASSRVARFPYVQVRALAGLETDVAWSRRFHARERE
jgi:hypothetical protein